MHDAQASRAGETSVPLTASAVLVNKVGLHARPSVKLTQFAKSFAARSSSPSPRTGPGPTPRAP